MAQNLENHASFSSNIPGAEREGHAFYLHLYARGVGDFTEISIKAVSPPESEGKSFYSGLYGLAMTGLTSAHILPKFLLGTRVETSPLVAIGVCSYRSSTLSPASHV